MAQSMPFHRARDTSSSDVHDAQDSQAILDALKAEFGLVALSSSECINGDGAGGSARINYERGPRRSAAIRISRTQPPRAGDDMDPRRTTRTQLRDSGHSSRAVGSDDAVVLQSSPSPRRGAARPQRENTEAPEGSPTQLNTIRDDSDDPAVIGSRQDTQEGELRALRADETGAVNFDDVSPVARVSSQVSEDAGFENTRSEWRSSSNNNTNVNININTPFKARDLAPETPGLSRNPFSADREASKIPLAGSQLFGETQPLTSAVKHSPTMSRPSPRMLYEMVSPDHPEPSSLKGETPQPAPMLHGEARRLYEDDLALESPTVKRLKPSRAGQPLAHYEPMKRSQERKASGGAPDPIALGNGSDSDDDAFLVLERRRRIVEKKKAQAARELESVSFVRPGHGESGVSPGRKRRKLNGAPSTDCQRSDATEPSTTRKKRGETAPREPPRRPAPPLGMSESALASQTVADEEMIPATSPAPSIPPTVAGIRNDAAGTSDLSPATREALHQLVGDMEDDLLSPSSDVPLARKRTRRSYGRQLQAQRPPTSSSSPGAPTPSRHLRPASQAVTMLSIVSTLTPAPSSDPSPDTAVALPASEGPTARKTRRPRSSRHPFQDEAPPLMSIDSVDELQRSPTSSTAGHSVANSKSGRAPNKTFRQAALGSINHLPRGRRLFEGMAFAISMQAEQDCAHRAALEKRITQAGGIVLEDGFQALFEASPAMSTRRQMIEQGDALRLAQSSSEYGFTALIADGHSRKPKYMQALALGLPCLAYQWIAACLGKGEMVDWEPYLLAAGSSAALGDAVRSRCLKPYPAAGARLGEVVERRPRLLEGQSMLLVASLKGGGRNWSGNEREYIFLALALGPSVYRVPTAKEAYETLSAHERAGDPFDWIYVDENIGTVEAVLSVEERWAAKKRKKAAAATPSRVHSTRVLSNELVIQSLISGRMVGEDEIS